MADSGVPGLLVKYEFDDARVDPETGEFEPVVTIVTDNGGPFRSFTFEAFITARPAGLGILGCP